jgi:glucose dehydrogenase
VDLKEGVVVGKDKQIDLERGEIGLHSTPTVVNDTVIVGSSMEEGLSFNYHTSMNTKGLVRAFDVRTGKQIWRFNTIHYPGQAGNDTWENGHGVTGNMGVWTQITVDPDAGLVICRWKHRHWMNTAATGREITYWLKVSSLWN